MLNQDFDAVVVGSGVSGGWAAKELTQKGLKTLLIERGRAITPADYRGEHKGAWEFPFRQVGDRSRYAADYPIQRLNSMFGEANEQFFVKDSEHPYEQDPNRPFIWFRGYQLGGRSLTWGRLTPRWGAINFLENAHDGHGIDWPIRYEDIRPWYEHVEKFIGVSGQTKIDFPTAPVGHYLPPFPLNCCEEHLAAGIKAKFDDRRLVIAPVAILTRDHNGRAACHYCGPCDRGCSTGSYFSSISSTLPAARATGLLTTVTDTVVHSLEHDPVTRRVTGVRAINAKTRERTVYRGRMVFLNAATLPTTQILLNSVSEHYPNGLGNTSGVLGHYLMDHVTGAGAIGVIPGLLDRRQIGNKPASMYMPRFRNVDGKDSPFERGFAFQGVTGRVGWTRGTTTPGFGADLKKELRSLGPWFALLSGFGECLPRYENRVSLDPGKRDEWDMPLINTSFGWGENELLMAKHITADAREMLEAVGAQGIQELSNLSPGGMGIHEMGTARMGRDPKTSFLNAFNQSHEVRNLFVTDGACMASSANQNPSLTYMALTARAAHYAVEQLKQHRL
jgi:choline dehydrogenase-like flavoprotein